MHSELKWVKFLENETAMRSILLGEKDLPPYPGNSGSQGYQLYLIAVAIRNLFQGDFESANSVLTGIGATCSRLLCHDLAVIWYAAELEDPYQCWKKLGHWLDEHKGSPNSGWFSQIIRPITALDRQLALRWAPALRYYLTTLFGEWPAEVLATAARDRQAARKNGVSEAMLVRIDFMMRFAQARQQKSVPLILETARAWQDLCRQSPDFGNGGEYLLEAAVALEYEDKFTEALDWLEQGLRLDPDLYELLVVKARILKRIGDAKGSLEACDYLVRLAPDDFTGYCLRSNTYFLLGRYDKAMADARKACEVAPQNPNSFMARAFVQMQLGHYEDALEDFDQTLLYDPLRYDALRGKGKCLSMLGRDFEALASFTALRRDYPNDPDLYYELADVLFSAGYLDDCQKTCRKCLELDDKYVSAYVILGMIALRRNDDESAHRLLNKAVSLEPDNPFALNELAYLMHLEGDDETALELIGRALEESPEYADALCNKGIILYFRSEFELAATIFDQTLKLAPDHVAALVGKGNTLTQLCEFDEALRCFDQALSLDPENSDACHGKAVLYRMIGLDDEVRKWQEKAYMLDDEEDD